MFKRKRDDRDNEFRLQYESAKKHAAPMRLMTCLLELPELAEVAVEYLVRGRCSWCRKLLPVGWPDDHVCDDCANEEWAFVYSWADEIEHIDWPVTTTEHNQPKITKYIPFRSSAKPQQFFTAHTGIANWGGLGLPPVGEDQRLLSEWFKPHTETEVDTQS